jgi:hypothetical protein
VITVLYPVAAAAQAAAPAPAEVLQVGSPVVIAHRRGVVTVNETGYSLTAHITIGERFLTVRGPDTLPDWTRMFAAIFADEPFAPVTIEPAFAYGGLAAVKRTPWVLFGDAQLVKAAAAVLPTFVLTAAGGEKE